MAGAQTSRRRADDHPVSRRGRRNDGLRSVCHVRFRRHRIRGNEPPRRPAGTGDVCRWIWLRGWATDWLPAAATRRSDLLTRRCGPT